MAFAEQCLNVAVFGRRVEGCLYRQQEGHHEGRPEPALVITERDGQCQPDRDPGRPAHHLVFRVFIGTETSRSKKHDKWQQDQGIDDGSQDHLLRAVINLENRILNNDFMSEIDKGVHKAGQQKGEGTTLAE